MMNKVILLAFLTVNIFVVLGGVIAAGKIQRAEAVCPPGTIIKGRVAIALPECQKVLDQEKEENLLKSITK